MENQLMTMKDENLSWSELADILAQASKTIIKELKEKELPRCYGENGSIIRETADGKSEIIGEY